MALASIRRTTVASIALFLAAGSPPTAGAQGRARVDGTVVEPTTGLPIPNVEVRLLGTDRIARTDSGGAFRLTVDAGHYLVRTTRLGFGPRSVALDLAAGDTITMSIEMDVLPVRLAEVLVRTREERYRGKMAGFAERMRTSGASRSSFITRDEISRPWRSTQALRRHRRNSPRQRRRGLCPAAPS